MHISIKERISPGVKNLRQWLLDILACHVLLTNPVLDSDDASTTVKVSALITVSLPLLVALGSFVVLYSQPSTLETVKSVIVVGVLVIYFGVSSVTDRVYERNLPEIRLRASQIQSNPNQGLHWARMRLIKIYAINLGLMTLIVIMVKLLT